MAAPGWIKIHRALLDHWCATEPEALAVWVRLLCEANFEDKKANIGGRLIDVKRGQLVFGLNAFSDRSGVSVKVIRRVISQLESDGMLGKQNFNKFSLITITCYDEYQDEGKQKASKGQAEGKQRATPKEVKKLRSEEVSDSLSSELDAGIEAVIEKLNDVTGQKLLSTTKVHRENISARLNEGFTVEQLVSIVECKAAEWMGTRFQSYLKPENLFRPKNFHKNLSQAEIASSVTKAEDLAEVYNELMTELPPVSVITTKMRSEVTEFCLKGEMDKEKFRNYLIYVRENCKWISSGEYKVGFDYLVNIDTLLKVRGDLMNDRTAR